MAKNKKNLGMSRSQIERSKKIPKRDRFGKKPLPSNYFDEKEGKFKEHIDINEHGSKPKPGQIIQQLPANAGALLSDFNVSLRSLDTISELEKRIRSGMARPWLPPVIYRNSRTLHNPRHYQYSPEDENDTDKFIKSNSGLGLYQYDELGNQIQTRNQITPVYYNQCHSGGDTNWDDYDEHYSSVANEDGEISFGDFAYGDAFHEYDVNIGDCGYVTWFVLYASATRCQSMCERYCSGTTDSSNCNNGVTGPDGAVHYPQYNDNPYDSDTPPNGGCGIYNICGTNPKHDDDYNTYEVVWASWARVTCEHQVTDTDCRCQCRHNNTYIRTNEGYDIGSQNISTTPGGNSGDVTPDGSDGSNEDTWEPPKITACFFDEACNDAGTNLNDAGAYSWCYDHPNGIYYPPGYQGDNVATTDDYYCIHNSQLCDYSCYGCTNPTSPSYDSSATKSCNGTYGPEGEMNHDFGGGTNSCCDFEDIRTTGNRFRLRYTWDEVAVNLVGDPYTDTAGTLNVFWTNSFVGTRGRSINWAEDVPFILEDGVVPEYLSGNNLYPKIGSSFWLNWTKYGDVCKLNNYSYISTSTGEDTLLLDPFTDVNSTLVNCDGALCGPNASCGSTTTIQDPVCEDCERPAGAILACCGTLNTDIEEGCMSGYISQGMSSQEAWDTYCCNDSCSETCTSCNDEFTISANPIEYDWFGFDGNPHPSVYDPVALSYNDNDWLPTKVRLTIEGTPELVGDVLRYSYRATSENIDRVGFIYVNKFTGLQGSGEGNSNNGTLITWSQTDGSTETGYVKDIYGNINLDISTEYSMDIILDNGGTFKMWTGSDSHLEHPKDYQYGEYIVNAPAGMFRREGSDDYEGIYEINTTPLDAVANDDVYCETWDGETSEECGYFKLSFCNNETSDEDVLDSWVVDGVNNLNDRSNENIWKNVNRNPGPAWFNSKPLDTDDESDGEPPNINTLWKKSIDQSCAFETIPEDGDIQKSPHLSITKSVLYDRPIKEEETLDSDGNVIDVKRTSFKYEYGHCNTTPVNSLVKTFEGYFAVDNTGKITGPVMGTVVDGGNPGGRIRFGTFKTGCNSTIDQNYDCGQLNPLICDTFGSRYGCLYSNVNDMCECDSPHMGCGENNLSDDACTAGTRDLDFCIGDQSDAFAGTANSVEIPSSDAVFDEYCAQSNYDTIFLLNTGTLLSSIKHHDDEVVSEDESYLDWKSGYSNVNNWNPGATLYGAHPTLRAESMGPFDCDGSLCHDYYGDDIEPQPMKGDVRRLNGKFDNMYRNHHLKISGKSKHKWCFNYYADWENFNGDDGVFCTEGDWSIKGTNAMDKISETEYPSGTSTKLLQFGSKRGNLMIPQHIKVGVNYGGVFVSPDETFKYTFSGDEAVIEDIASMSSDGGTIYYTQGPYPVASYATPHPALTANNFCLTKGFDAVLDYDLTSIPLGAPYWYHCGDTPNEAQFEISDKFTSLFNNLQGITYYKDSGSPGWPEDQFVGKPSICQGVIMEWKFDAQTAQMIDNLAFGQEEQQYAYYDLTADIENLLDFPFYLSTYPSDFEGGENDYEGWMYPGGGYLSTHHQVRGGGQFHEVGHVYKVFDGVDYKLAVCTDIHYSEIYYNDDIQYDGWGPNGELSFPNYSRFSIRKGFAPRDVVDHFIQYLLPPCPADGTGMANDPPFFSGWNVGYNDNSKMDNIECVIYPNGQNSGGEIPSDIISPASDFNAEIKLLGDHSHWKQNSGNQWFGINNYQPIDQGGTGGIFTERLSQDYLNAVGSVPMGWSGNQSMHPIMNLQSDFSSHYSPTGEGDAAVDYKLGREWYEPGVCKMVEPQGYYLLPGDSPTEINYNWPCEDDVSNQNEDVSRNYILNSVYNLPELYDSVFTWRAGTGLPVPSSFPTPFTWNITAGYLDEFQDETDPAFQAFYKSIYNPETSLMNYIITRGAYWETAQSAWAYSPNSLTIPGNYDFFNYDGNFEQWVNDEKGLCPYCLGHKYHNQFRTIYYSKEYDEFNEDSNEGDTAHYNTESLENNYFTSTSGTPLASEFMNQFCGQNHSDINDIGEYYNCYYTGFVNWNILFKNFWLGNWATPENSDDFFQEGYTVNFRTAGNDNDWSSGQGYYGNQNPFPTSGYMTDLVNRTRDITLSANKYTIDLLCQSMGFESGKVMSWKNTASGCSRYKRHMMFEPYYSDGSNPYDTDIPRLYLSHGQANVPILQDTAWKNVELGYDLSSEAPYGEQFLMGNFQDNYAPGGAYHMWDTLEGLGYRGVTSPPSSENIGGPYDVPSIGNGSQGAFYCPYGPAVIPHDIVCYSQDIWSPAQNYMYGEARHNHYQAKCDSFYNKDDFMAWFKAYYFAYYDRTISWMEAYEHPLFGEEVPYFVASEDPQNLKVRECGPEIVLLPSSEFIDDIEDTGVNVAWYPGQRAGAPTTESIIKPWSHSEYDTYTIGTLLGTSSFSGLELYAPTPEQSEAFSYINYSLMSRTTYEKSCGTCPQDYVCRISISNGSKCQSIDDTSDDDTIHNDVNYGLLIFDNSWLDNWYTNSNDSVLYRQISPTYDNPIIVPGVNKPPSPL